MPNIKSAIKRVEVAKNNTARNKAQKSELATYIKRFKKALADKNLTLAQTEYVTLVGLLDKAARENIIHKNNADRKKAHFAKLLAQ